MLMGCFEISPIDVFRISNYRYTKKEKIWNILQDVKQLENLGIKNLVPIQEFIELFNGKDGFIKKANNSRLDEVFVEVLNKSGLLKKILEKPHAQEILQRIARLYDEVKEHVGRDGSYSLRDFIDYLDLLEEHNVSLKKNTHVIPEGVVRLMTTHKAKGLEFDYVFVMNTYNTHWGNKIQRGARFNIPWEYLGKKITQISEDENSDERRLFYVALTRARKNAFITFSNSSREGREQIASQFLSEISNEFIEDIDVSKFERKFNSNLENIFKSSDKKGHSFSKEFIKEVFVRQGISVSALNNYLECPWKYFFNNLLRVPEKIDDAGLFGNAIHDSLNQYIISLKKGRVTKELVLEKFRESNYLKSITPNEVDRFVKRGEEALLGFYEEKLRFLKPDVETELEIRGIRITDYLFLNGKIDMIEPLDKNFRVNVYDFKTGSIKSRNEIEGKTMNSLGNYKRQLVFYKILLDHYRNGFFKMKNGIIEFVEPNENGIYKRELFEITDQETKGLLNEIIRVSNEVINLEFWNKKCDNRDCKYCKLSSYIV
jgi:DNA helicase-2/ATP-dependent DNA helicase PcrA